MAVPHLSHLVGLASPQMSTPTALGGHAAGEMRLVFPQPTVPPVLLPPAGSPPKLWGPRGQLLAVVNTSTSTNVCVYVCTFVCVVCVCTCAYLRVYTYIRSESCVGARPMQCSHP